MRDVAWIGGRVALAERGHGRRRAASVRRGARTASAPAAFPRRTAAVLVLVGLTAAWQAGMLPAAVALGYVALSGAAVLAYAIDKSAAIRGRRRISERSLHLLALVGGWPGALFAQGAFRHKSGKRRFLVLFWATVLVNLAALAWLLAATASSPGQVPLPRP